MRDDVFYVSGSHGSGKSTLLKGLIDTDPEMYKRLERIPNPSCDDIFDRAKIRMGRYLLHTYMEDNIVKENPGKRLFCDRCILDVVAYQRAFLKLGWIAEEKVRDIEQSVQLLFTGRMPQNVIFLDVSLDILIRNIKNRWETKPKKWREDNFEYLDATRQAFQDFYSVYPGNVLRLTSTDLSERVEICKRWMSSIHTKVHQTGFDQKPI